MSDMNVTKLSSQSPHVKIQPTCLVDSLEPGFTCESWGLPLWYKPLGNLVSVRQRNILKEKQVSGAPLG